MEEQKKQNEEREAEAVAEAAAASVAESIAAKGSNRGTGTKYALMTTLEENASIDAIEDLVVSERQPGSDTTPFTSSETKPFRLSHTKPFLSL